MQPSPFSTDISQSLRWERSLLKGTQHISRFNRVDDPPTQNLTFPLEIWRKIFDNIYPISQRTPLMGICHALSNEAKASRCISLTLSSHKSARAFYLFLLRSPQTAPAVRRLFLYAVTLWGAPSVPAFIPALLSRLTELKVFRLDFFPTLKGRDPLEVRLRFDAQWFPRLRKLAVCLPAECAPGLAGFLHAHTGLCELYLPAPEYSGAEENEAERRNWAVAQNLVLPELKVLSCPGAFLVNALATEQMNITHLAVHGCKKAEMEEIARRVGDTLVSLSLGMPRLWRHGRFSEGESWSVRDVAVRFPKLRMLHTDVVTVRLARLSGAGWVLTTRFAQSCARGTWRVEDVPPVRWDKSGALDAVAFHPSHKIDIVWSGLMGSPMGGFAGALDAAAQKAREVVEEWGDYVECVRIPYNGFCRTISRDEDVMREVSVVDVQNLDWKLV